MAFSLSISPLSAPTFPVSKRSDGRGYLDGAGRPFMGVADTAWNLLSRATIAEVTSYAATRRAQGYTMVLTSYLDINSRTRTQVTTGVTPFTGTGNSADFTAPNQTYMDAVKAKLDVLRDAGLYVWIIPGWYGFSGNMWRPNWAANATDYTKANSFAAYLAAQLGGRPEVGWLHGGDNAPDATGGSFTLVTVTNTFAAALKAASATAQLHTYHAGRGMNAADWFAGQSWYDIDAAYSATDVPVETTVEWARGRAVAFVEGYYSNRDTVGLGTFIQTRLQLRNTAWHAITTGAFLEANGNEVVWQWRDFYGSYVWNDATYGVNDVTSSDITILSRVLASFPGANWVADAAAPLVTSNRGSGVTLSSAVMSSDGKNAIIYLPASKTVTIDPTPLSPGRSAAWVNPQTGETLPLALSGTAQSVTTPLGWEDALIVITANGVAYSGSSNTDLQRSFYQKRLG